MDDEVDQSAVEEEFDDYEEDLEQDVEDPVEQDEDVDEVDDEETATMVSDKKLDDLTKNIIRINDKNDDHQTIHIIPDDERITSEIIQLPEMVEAIGCRASQIEKGVMVLTDVTGYKDPILMAKKEFIDRCSPLILEREIRRVGRDVWVEHWIVREMSFPIVEREALVSFHDLKSQNPIDSLKNLKSIQFHV